ncbi:hypothetical protein FOCC_FOCC013413 [Frankliniella occidentalis]|nr:hypothetical protein FOCC_FOCC013413 [Frankliniella occidentalis]
MFTVLAFRVFSKKMSTHVARHRPHCCTLFFFWSASAGSLCGVALLDLTRYTLGHTLEWKLECPGRLSGPDSVDLLLGVCRATCQARGRLIVRQLLLLHEAHRLGPRHHLLLAAKTRPSHITSYSPLCVTLSAPLKHGSAQGGNRLFTLLFSTHQRQSTPRGFLLRILFQVLQPKFFPFWGIVFLSIFRCDTTRSLGVHSVYYAGENPLGQRK